MQVVGGSTNVTCYMYCVEDVGGTNPGEPKTGLLFSNIETGGSASYMRQGAVRTDVTLVTQTVAGAHTDGGFVEVDATNMPGVYRYDPPDAAFAAGADVVVLSLVAAAANNCIFAPKEIDITSIDANVTQWLGTAAATPTTAGVPEVDVTFISGTAQTGLNVSSVVANINTQVGTAGDGLTNINLPNQTMDITGNITGNLSGSVGSVTGAVGSVTGAVGSVTGAVGSVAGNVDGSVASVVGAVGSVVGHTAQTGDSFARIGLAGAGLTDLGGMSTVMKAEVNAEADTALTDYAGATAAALATAQLDLDTITGTDGATLATAQANYAPATAASVAALNDVAATDIVSGGAITTVGGAVSNVTTVGTTTTNTDMRGTDGANTATPLDAAGVRTALGLATANLDTQLASADLTAQLTESYAANGVAPTMAQAVLAIQQMLMQFGISGTSLTVRKLDNVSTAFVVTLDSDSAPTDASRV